MEKPKYSMTNPNSHKLDMVVHAFNPSTWEAEAGRFLSLKLAWFTELVPGQPWLHRETLSQKKKKTRKQKQIKTNKQTNKKQIHTTSFYKSNPSKDNKGKTSTQGGK
jgi:ABC-type phosphate/phosphonate transport system substrate-binding protein